jgi:hypothetical protein
VLESAAVAAVPRVGGQQLVHADARRELRQLHRQWLAIEWRREGRHHDTRRRYDGLGPRPAERLQGRKPDHLRDLELSDGVFFYVSYEGTSTWNTPKNTGQVHGNNTAWTLSNPTNLQPYNVTGWQPMRITLIPGGNTSDFQIYNLYIDPRMRC